MDYEIVELEEKVIVGLVEKTANNDVDMMAKIGQLWQRLFDTANGDSLFTSIRNKTNYYSYGVYCDYADDSVDQSKLNYTVMAGVSVSKNEDANLETRIIPKGKYAKFVAKGNMHTAVGECWEKIWQTPLDRAFTADFEEYVSSDMENCTINIYVAIR